LLGVNNNRASYLRTKKSECIKEIRFFGKISHKLENSDFPPQSLCQRNPIFILKEIRFFGKIGFLTKSKKSSKKSDFYSQRNPIFSSKSDFFEKSDFSQISHRKASCQRNPIFILKEIRFFAKIGFLTNFSPQSLCQRNPIFLLKEIRFLTNWTNPISHRKYFMLNL
jgi:hypothetical protein